VEQSPTIRGDSFTVGGVAAQVETNSETLDNALDVTSPTKIIKSNNSSNSATPELLEKATKLRKKRLGKEAKNGRETTSGKPIATSKKKNQKLQRQEQRDKNKKLLSRWGTVPP